MALLWKRQVRLGWAVPVLVLRVEPRRRGKMRLRAALKVGREAQMIAVLISTADQRAALTLS